MSAPPPYIELHATRRSPSSTGPRPRRAGGRGGGTRLSGAGADRPRWRLGLDGVRPRAEGSASARSSVRADDPPPELTGRTGGLEFRPIHVTLLVEDASGYGSLCRLDHRGARGYARRTRHGSRNRPGRRWTRSSGTPRGWSACRVCARDGASPGTWSAATGPGEKLGRRLLAPSAATASGSSCSGPLASRPFAQPLALPCSPSASASPPSPPATPMPTPARAPTSRTRWSRSGAAKPWSRASRGGAATRPRRSPPPRRWRRASPSTPRRSPRASGSPSASPSTSPPSSATATPAPRTRGPTVSSPGSAPTPSASATPATHGGRSRAPARGGAGDDPRPRPLRLLPPPPRHAGAGP